MNKKDTYNSLLLIFLGIVLHFLFKDLNKFVGITSIIVGTCYFLRFIITKNDKKLQNIRESLAFIKDFCEVVFEGFDCKINIPIIHKAIKDSYAKG